MKDLRRSSGDRRYVVLSSVRAVDPAIGLDDVVDVVIEDGRITRVGVGAASSEMKTSEQAHLVDGRGAWLLPAFVDLHAHLREPGQEYKEDIASGLAAADVILKAHGRSSDLSMAAAGFALRSMPRAPP